MEINTILTKEKLNERVLIGSICKMLELETKDIMYIEDTDGWINKQDEAVVIEYLGVADDEIAKGMHMYDIHSNTEIKIKELQKYIDNKLYDSEEF